jgi:AbrB family looped-hinge helix DNA binding protein
MRITSKGQITIPAFLREQYGLLPHSEVEVVESEHGVLIRKRTSSYQRGEKLIQHMVGRSTVKMSTDEIMRLSRGDDD